MHSAATPTKKQSLIEGAFRFVEHGAFLTVAGIVGSLMIFLSNWFLLVPAACLALAFHRAEAVKGRSMAAQVTAYALILTIGVFTGLGIHEAVEKQEGELISQIAALFPRNKGGSDLVTAQVQSSLIAFGRGSCSFFMESWAKGGEAYASPVVFLAWIRVNNGLDYSLQVDSFSVDIAQNAGGPWISTQVISGSDLYYTRDNLLRDRNTVAYRKSFEALPNGSVVVASLGSVYAFSTADDSRCMQKVSLVGMISLSDQLKSGLSAKGITEGWAAFNPSELERAVLMSGERRLFYRIKLNTSAGIRISYGEFRSLVNGPSALTHPDSINFEKFGDASADLTSQQLHYLGPASN